MGSDPEDPDADTTLTVTNQIHDDVLLHKAGSDTIKDVIGRMAEIAPRPYDFRRCSGCDEYVIEPNESITGSEYITWRLPDTDGYMHTEVFCDAFCFRKHMGEVLENPEILE